MAKRLIVKIDEEKCTGCGKCVSPCAEGAIQIINGKAKGSCRRALRWYGILYRSLP
ncbi:MAG: 4Fe-4S binding protein [Methanolobus sp.]